MCPSAEAYTHKDCGQQVMLRPSLLIPLVQMKGVLEKLTGLVLNTSEHTQLPAFHLLEIHVFHSFHVLKKFHVFFQEQV